jgi:Zn finger protein HypA/HybF involved in hydrogenase expression
LRIIKKFGVKKMSNLVPINRDEKYLSGKMKIRQNKYIFMCRKCQSYIEVEKIEKLVDLDCPECGEEGDELYLFSYIKDDKKNENF